MKPFDAPHDPDTDIPQIVLSLLCNVRSITKDKHDYECYEQAIEAVTRVRALAKQRENALKALSDLGERIDE